MKAENINDLNQLLDRLHAHYSYSEDELKERKKLIRYILMYTTVDELSTFTTDYLRELLDVLEG